MTSPSLLVKLSAFPENKVFVAMPFTNEFEELKKVILQAIYEVRYLPVHIGEPPMYNDNEPRSICIETDYTRGIQSSKLVIAVCSPESRYSTSNPNVMYELGFAKSLGKAVIILTNDHETIPSDIRSYRHLEYRNEEVESGAFQRRLANNLIEVLNRVDQSGSGVIDGSSESTKVVLPQHWIHLEPTLWNAFTQIINCGKVVHHAIQPVENLHLSKLKKLVYEILYGSQDSYIVEPKKADLLIDWTEYESHYRKHLSKLVNSNKNDPEKKQEILRSYDLLISHVSDLQNPINNSSRIIENLEKSRDFYNLKCSSMNDYDQHHCEAVSCLTSMEGSWNSSGGPTLYCNLERLIRGSRVISTHADSMILNLVNLFDTEA
jgi:nucleoside 2-deoxyribosyltransferase